MNLKSLALGLGTLLLFASSARAQSRGSFTGAVNYPAGAPVTPTNTGYLQGGVSPVDLAKGDFNGDGKMDVAVLASCSSLNFPTCPRENGAAVAVYLNNGDGTFTGPILSGDLNGEPRALVVGDFDGDGNLDVAAASDCLSLQDCSSGSITILFGDGHGRFPTQSASYPLNGSVSYPGTMAIGHFHDPQILDLAVGVACYNGSCNSGAIEVFLGTGTGNLGSMAMYLTPGNGAVYPVVGDFDKDGIQDIVAATFYAPGDNAHSAIQFMKGNGDGTFTLGLPKTLSYFGLTAIAAGDFNSDQSLDLAITFSGGNTLQIFNGNGNGTFQDPVTIQASLAAASTNGNTIVVADLNGDGKPDLAIAGGFGPSQINGAQMFVNDGQGNFNPGPSYPMGGWEFVPIVVADFNSDGNADIVMASALSEIPSHAPDGTIGVLFGNGDGSFQGPSLLKIPTSGIGTYSAGAADFNSDGVSDLFTSVGCAQDLQSCDVGILLSRPDGTYQPPTAVLSGAQIPYNSISADFNGDGFADLAVVNECDSSSTCNSPSVTVSLGNGDGTFKPGVTYPVSGIAGPVWIVSGDFDGDGKLDLAAVVQCSSDCSQGVVNVLRGKGDGTFLEAVPTGTGSGVVVSIAAADFNRDGRTDLAVANINATQGEVVTIITGNSDGTMTVRGTYASGGSSYGSTLTLSVAAADINHDGNPDVVVANQCEAPAQADAGCANGSIGVLLGVGDGTFQPVHEIVVADANFASVALADVDGDGNLDFVGSISDGIVVARGDGQGNFIIPTAYAGLNVTSTKSIVVSDLNNDGALDVIQPDVNGNLAVFYNRGGTRITSQTSVTPAAFGQSVTFTATVIPSLAESQTPSGTVTFFDGNTSLGAPPLVAGTASFTTSSLGVGAHSVAPAYSGDANFNSHTGPAIAQSVVSTAPSVFLSSSSLSFGLQPVGTPSTFQVVTVTSTGSGSVTFGTISVSGTNAGDFSVQNNTCSGSLSTPNSCSFGVIFAPAASGPRSASISIADNASGSPQLVALSGTGTAAVIGLSPVSLSFSAQPVSIASSPKPVTLTNTGNAALSISSVTVTTGFSQTNNCPLSLAAAASCTINVSFKPTTSGAGNGSVSVSGSASNSPQSVSLAGSGTDFTVAASPSSRTIKQGKSTSYTMTVAPVSGFTGSVSLACSGVPANSTCSVTPTSVSLNGVNSSSATLTVVTAAGKKGTPKGTYSVTLRGSFSTLSHTTSVTLVVQ